MQLFLSHSSIDKPLAREIYLELRTKGVDVFLDEMKLHPTENLKIELEHHLYDAEVFLLLWSKNANRKWVLWELKQAVKKAITGKTKILVAVLDDEELPKEVRDHIFIDFRPSFRRGVSHLLGFVTEERTVLIGPQDEIYRPDMHELDWYLASADHPLHDKWSVVLDDAGIFDHLRSIYLKLQSWDPGAQVMDGLFDGQVERSISIQNGNRALGIASYIATEMVVGGLSTLEPGRYNRKLIIESVRRYLAWSLSRAFIGVSRYLTHQEFDSLDIKIRESLGRLYSLVNGLDANGLGSDRTSDPIDLLLASESPLDRERFVEVDAVLSDAAREAIRWGYVTMYLPQHRPPMSGWAKTLISGDWPPPSHYLTSEDWFLLFVPQIAREITHASMGQEELPPATAVRNAFTLDGFIHLGPH